MDEFNKALCEERHKMLDVDITKIFEKFDRFSTLLVATLLSTIGSLILIVVSILTRNIK